MKISEATSKGLFQRDCLRPFFHELSPPKHFSQYPKAFRIWLRIREEIFAIFSRLPAIIYIVE
jgi:hypothetical protein